MTIKNSEMTGSNIDFQEINRQRALFEYTDDFTTHEEVLDEITDMVAYICDSPITCIELIDSSKIWYKSKKGLDVNFSENNPYFLNFILDQKDVFQISNSSTSNYIKNLPILNAYPKTKFYAGIPLISQSGFCIGVLSLTDFKDRQLEKNQISALISFAKFVINFFELKKCDKELKQANEKNNKLEKLKNDFISKINHEMKTPLNAINGFTDLLSRTQLNSNQEQMLNIIKSSVEILEDKIDNILDFSDIATGKFVLENYLFNLEEAIRNIKELFSQKAKEKENQFIINYDKKLPKIIKGDKKRINQILFNLISNAIKFTEKGYIELTISLEEEIEEEVKINFILKDTGIGIEKKKLTLILESFMQADNDNTRKYGGIGLGLSLSKRLIELLGGKLKVESEFGKGSIFSFSLILKKENELILKNHFINQKDLNSNKSDLEKEIISFNYELKNILKKDVIEVLLCEDNYFNSLLVEKIFEYTPIKLDHAKNGKIGLEKFEKKDYDFILLDLQMPELDGFEFARQIRKVKKSDIMMLAITANEANSDRRKCIELGINDYFKKPFKKTNLLEGIIRNLKKKNNVKTELKTPQNIEQSFIVPSCLLGFDDLKNKNIENNINFEIERYISNTDFDFSIKNENILSQSNDDKSNNHLAIFKVNRKDNLLRIIINEEILHFDLKTKEKSSNYKDSFYKINSSFLETDTENDIIFKVSNDSECNSDIQNKKSLISNFISDFSTQDEFSKDKVRSSSDFPTKKKNSLFLNNNKNNVIRKEESFGSTHDNFPEKKNTLAFNNKNFCYSKMKNKNVYAQELFENCDSDFSISFDIDLERNTQKLEKSENELIGKSHFNTLKSKVFKEDIENGYQMFNPKINCFRKFSGESKSEILTYQKPIKQKNHKKSRSDKSNLNNHQVNIIEKVNKSLESIYNQNNNFDYNTDFHSILDNQDFILLEKKPIYDMNNSIKEDIIINYDYLNEISGGDLEFEKELAKIFLKEIPIQISKLKTALKNRDLKELHILSHSMKTSFSMIVIENLKEKFIALEKLVKNFNHDINLSNGNQDLEEINLKLSEMFNWLIKEFDFYYKIVEENIKKKYSLELK